MHSQTKLSVDFPNRYIRHWLIFFRPSL